MNAAWGGQWDRGAIMISMGAPVFTDFPLITYEPVSHSYFSIGEKVGNAFSDGKKLK